MTQVTLTLGKGHPASLSVEPLAPGAQGGTLTTRGHGGAADTALPEDAWWAMDMAERQGHPGGRWASGPTCRKLRSCIKAEVRWKSDLFLANKSLPD